MAKYVVSTLSASVRYCGWVKEEGGLRRIERSVLIKGGANVARRAKGDTSTPEGVLTRVTDDEARFLSEDSHFKRHQARGFVRIVDRDRDPDTVAQKMTKDEGSRPRTPADVKADSKKSETDPGTGIKAVVGSK